MLVVFVVVVVSAPLPYVLTMPPVPCKHDGILTHEDEGVVDDHHDDGLASAPLSSSSRKQENGGGSSGNMGSNGSDVVVRNEMAKKNDPNVYKVLDSWDVCLRSAVIGIVAALALHNYTNIFADSYKTYWLGVFLVSQAIDMSSPAMSAICQYLFPFALLAYCTIVEGYVPSLFQAVMVFPSLMWCIGVPMSICLHRYFSHQAFSTSRPVQAILGFVACWAYQHGPLWWAAKHVRHHHHCDQPGDPHSVYLQGYYYAWFGWTMNPINLAESDEKYNYPAHLRCPELKFLDRFPLIPVCMALTAADIMYGRAFSAYSVLLPMLLCRLITLLFNVDFHPVTEQDKRCKSINGGKFLTYILGEDLHDIHHRKPNQSKRTDHDFPCTCAMSFV